MAGAGALITRVYTGFRGVDFRGGEIDIRRSPDSFNMWKDYKEINSIRTRPSLRQLANFDDEGQIWGIYFYEVDGEEHTLVHKGTKLWEFSVREYEGEDEYEGFEVEEGVYENTYRVWNEIASGLNPRPSQAFIYNNIFYFKDGINFLQWAGGDEEAQPVEGYVPTTSIGRRPAGGGSTYEDFNLLTGIRINTFLGDGESVDYYLDAREIDDDAQPYITINGTPTEDFTVNAKEGKITFATAPPAPLTDGQDNVSIKFRKTKSEYRKRIENCTLLAVFDNRVFFSGNPDYPNTVWHSSLNDPTYCSDLDYYNEGLDFSPVKAMVAGNNALWVFKEPSQANTTVFYHNPVVDADYGKIYPSVHSSISTGCVATGINFNDDIVFFSDRGMEAINGDVTTEQVLTHRSSLVDSKLLAEEKYKDMILVEWEGYLVIITGKRMYLADSRAMATLDDHTEYEWFYWDLEHEWFGYIHENDITCATVHKGVLYLGTERGSMFTLNGNQQCIGSKWVTAFDNFGYPHHLKTTNKRGCVVDAIGKEIEMSAYANNRRKDTGSMDAPVDEFIGTFRDITDYFVGRVKKKKFKDIQLEFFSNYPFSLERVTLESYIGGYVKR